MARRMSNRERIERMALESAAAEEEKREKREKREAGKAKGTTRTSKAAKPKGAASCARRKRVWKVLDSSFREVSTFAYPERAKAEAEAARLSKESSKKHFVNPAEVPMDEE